MTAKQVSTWWWMLSTEFDERRLTFFGSTKEEVLGKYRAWMRRWDLEKLR